MAANQINNSHSHNKHQKQQFFQRALNSFHQGKGVDNQTDKPTMMRRLLSQSNDQAMQNVKLPAYQKPPVYVENKQFFYDIVYVPRQMQAKQVDKDIIHESVYGRKWRDKYNKSVKVSKSQLPQHINESERTTTQFSQKDLIDELVANPKKKINLNDVNSLYISSEEDDNNNYLQSFNETQIALNNISSQVKTTKFNEDTLNQNTQSVHSYNFDLKPTLLRKTDRQIEQYKNKIFHSEFVIENPSTINDQGGGRFSVRQKKNFDFSQRISEQAVFDYYRNYKNIKASVERDEHKRFPQSAYIQQCEKNQLIPRPYGLVSYKGQEEELNVQSFLMGNRYAQAFGQGLQYLETRRINLSNNRLNEKGTLNILKGINKKVVEDLDLSNNKMGQEGIDYLSGLIIRAEDGFNLKILKLEHTNITDIGLAVLLDALDVALDTQKCNLIELNLACNQITCTGAEKVAQYLAKDPINMRLINLHWNKIKIKGGLKIAEALTHNTNLKVLDMSWNAMGKINATFAGQMTVADIKKKLKNINSIKSQAQAVNQLSENERLEIETLIGKTWGKAFVVNKTLIHLDLSYNSFGVDTCTILQKKVKKNHTIYGLHMAGNACIVDSHGFIQIDEVDSQNQLPQPQQKLSNTDKKASITNTKKQSQSISRQTNVKEAKRSTASDIVMRSPQKEVLFKRIEGMKAVIKKQVQSITNSPSRVSNGKSLHINLTEQTPMSSPKKTKNAYDFENSVISSNFLNTSQPGKALQKFKVKDNCWICEGWSEFQFSLRVPQYLTAEVYLHFDFDDYRPDLMVPSEPGVYECYRMIPPGTHQYFMSVNGVEYFISGHQIIYIDSHQVNQIDSKLRKTLKEKHLVPFNLDKVNYIESQFQFDQSTISPVRSSHYRNFSTGSYQFSQGSRQSNLNSLGRQENQITNDIEAYTINKIKNCIPRPDKRFQAQKQDRPRTPWTFQVSLFREYKPENSSLVQDCFEFDWQCLKKPKLKASTEEDLKEKCREIYPFLREIYKRLAAFGIIGTIFSIGWNVYREFMIQGINITDKDKLKPDDCDRLFIGVNAGNQRKAPFIPEKGLVRFQFVEIMMKAAIKRYFDSGDVENEVAAMDELIKNHLNPVKVQSDISTPFMYNQHKWRMDRYWNEPCDNIYKAYAPLFTYLYNTYGGTHKKPGQKTFMTLDEFDNLIQTAGLINDLLNQRDIALHFNQAMMLQINEIDFERHFQATYIEFLEAFARACDQASFPPFSNPSAPKEQQSNQDQQQTASKQDQQTQQQPISQQQQTQDLSIAMTQEERQNQPLYMKIENTLPYVMKFCCKQKGFLDKFEIPKKHPQVGLYILPNKKFF